MSNLPRILVTGGSGFLGRFIRDAFSGSAQLTLLSRKGGTDFLKGDLTQWNAGLDSGSLEGKFDICLHMAGLYDLRVPKEDAILNNVIGTHTALALAEELKIPMFAHISTVAVTMPTADHRTVGDIGVAPDVMFTDGPFPDFYAESKSHGEKLVRAWSGGGMRKLILRPGILVGDTKTGHIGRIDGPYHAIDAFRRMRSVLKRWRGPLPLPGQIDRTMPLVPVDLAAKAIRLLTLKFHSGSDSTKSYYVAGSNGPTPEEVYRSALRSVGLDLDIEVFGKVPQAIVKPMAEWLVRFPREELDYVLNLPVLDVSATEEALGKDFFPRFSTYEDQMWSGYHAFVQNR